MKAPLTVRTALVVFAKEPTPGHVKTRLARTLGNAPAAAIYRELTALTLSHAVAARVAGVVAHLEVWCSPSPRSRHFRDLAASANATLHAQPEGDLGERMSFAIADALTRARNILLIGTDCPFLDTARLSLAAQCLEHHDAVLGPAEDGGYVLVGARTPLTFGDVRWSTSHALADTVAAFTNSRIRFTTLPVSWDVDEMRDLERWNALRMALPAA